MEDKKVTNKSTKRTKTYTGVVTSKFKIKDKIYNINDLYKTKHKESYDILIKSKRIK